eukprot:m.156652 g.156652  ORF g.156652 m.156652 type:complete len:452 (-) comp14441_c0_seq1:1474-2829(-)
MGWHHSGKADSKKFMSLTGAFEARYWEKVVETATEWRGVVVPGMATWGVIVIAGVLTYRICMLWHPLHRRAERRTSAQYAALWAVFVAVLLVPVLVVLKLGRHDGWCSPVGAALAFVLWMSGVLKTWELVHGFTEPGALRHSLEVWLLYFCAPTEPIFVDGKPMKLPSNGRWHLSRALGKVLVSTLILRALSGYAVALPDAERSGLGGTLLVGVVWCCLITQALSISQAVVVEHGFVPCGAMRFPLEASRSPGELWGERMDIAMNRMLKRSVYRPVRGLISGVKGRATATVATFLVSGLLHEVLWGMLWLASPNGYQASERPQTVGWQVGSTTAYFIVQCCFCIGATLVPMKLRDAAGKMPGPVLAYATLLFCTAFYLQWYLGPIYLDTHPEFIATVAKLFRAPRAAADWTWLTTLLPSRVFWGFIPRELVLHFAFVCMLYASAGTPWSLL